MHRKPTTVLKLKSTIELKRIIVTGATGAIGSEICRQLACKGYGVVLACRNKQKGEEVAASMPSASAPLVLTLDLSSESAARGAVKPLADMLPAGDIVVGVVNNAGTMARSFSLTTDGHEMDMAVNCLNTMAWTDELLRSGLLSRGAAIVFTTSITRKMGKGGEMPAEPTASDFSQLGSYARSKRALTIRAAELCRKLLTEGIAVNCADPGVVDSGMITMHRWFDPLSNIFFRPFIRKPSKGAVPAIRALEAGLGGSSGDIYCLRSRHKFSGIITENK